MHITYELRKFITKVTVNSNVVIDERLQSLKAEKEAILDVCGKLAYFIRTNSINPANDDILEYIQHFIREEKQKRNNGAQNDDIINGLEGLEKEYRHELDAIKQMMQANGTNSNCLLSIGEVFDRVRDLYHLPLYGKQIRTQIEQMKKMQEHGRRNREQQVQLLNKAQSSPVMIELKKVLA